MCGINGIIFFDQNQVPSKDTIQKMTEATKHRGPDFIDTSIWKNVAFGHNRLSILDLSSRGNQPMSFKNLLIVFNGEIYNFKEIRKNLIDKGYSFNSDSDTEVILNAYDCYGINFIDQLNGMFTFALLDKNINKVFLCRDRLGIKPLYYYLDDQKVIFSSETKGIKAYPNLPLSLNKKAISNYLNLLYIPHPMTACKEISKINPSCYIEIDIENRNLKEIKYWKIKQEENDLRYDQNKSKVHNLLIDSIDKRLIADVPVGAFLSGGVDSGLICAITSKELGKPLETFSVSYDQDYSFFNEIEYAKRVAKKYNHKHYNLEINLNDLFLEFENVISFLDEPNANPSAFLNHFLCEFTKQKVSVALSGLGGDELFGGYNRYMALNKAVLLGKLPIPFINIMKNAVSIFPKSRMNKLSNLNRAFEKILKSANANPEIAYNNLISYDPNNLHQLKLEQNWEDELNCAMRLDVEYYMVDDLLALTDKMSMTHALEVRVPFLDHRIVEVAFSIKSDDKINSRTSKKILKEIGETYLDKDILYRSKMGFSLPLEAWMHKLGREYISHRLNEFRFFDVVNKDNVLKIIDLFYTKKIDYSNQIYSYLVLDQWLRNNPTVSV